MPIEMKKSHLVPASKASANQVCLEVLDFANQVEHGFILHPVSQGCEA